MTVLRDDRGELLPLWMKATLAPSGMVPLLAKGLRGLPLVTGLSPARVGSVVVQPVIGPLPEMYPGHSLNELSSKLELGMLSGAMLKLSTNNVLSLLVASLRSVMI